MSRSLPFSLAAAAAASACLLAQLAAPVSATVSAPAASGVSYTYDADGRLAIVTDATGDAATYQYDAAGNVTSITRTTAAARQRAIPRPAPRPARPAVTSVAPVTVKVGQRLVISGRDFSRAAADVVSVGSLLATVLSASRSRLVVAAPPDAGGRVTVRTPAGTASFGAVAVSGAPRSAASAAPRQRPAPPPLLAGKGVTAISGTIQTASGVPLAGVRVTVSGSWGQAGKSAASDHQGRFLLSGLASGQHTLTIDASKLPGGLDYGVYSEPVELPSGRTTVLPWITYLTRIGTAHAVKLAVPLKRTVTLTTPQIPGLRVIIPPGTVIRDRNGKIVRSLSITRLPSARTPMPWGPSMVPSYFTIQPGDATVSGKGLSVIYPNSARQPPGEAVSYLAENPSWPGSGWYRYGGGHVSANGRQVVPDVGNRYHSTGPGGYSALPPPAVGAPPGSQCQCGDPVDLSTGLFDEQSTDIALPDVEGVAVTRTFRQLDDTVRDFGIGSSNNLDLYLTTDQSGDYDLVLPDGGLVDYTPTASTGVFQAVDTPTIYAGSTLTETSSDYDGPFFIALRDGTRLTFGDPALLVSITDRFGNAITINRPLDNDVSDGGGQIETVTTPSGRWLAFTYGVCVKSAGTECITKITDNSGRTVKYDYDAVGHLISFTNLNGGVTKYGWAPCDDAITCTELTSATDPVGLVTKITYDATTGLVTGQTQPNGGTWKYQYTTSSSGAVTQAIVTDPDGRESSTAIGTNGYSTSNVTGYGTQLAQTTTATYEPGTGLVSSVTDPAGRSTAYTYDSQGDLLTVTQLAGTAQAATTTYTYDLAYGRITSVTDPLGHTTTIAYDDAVGTETVTDPMGRQTIITLNDHGQPVSAVDPLGGVSYYSYFGGQLVAIADPLGNVASTYYDAAGRPLAITDPDGNTTSYAYDAAGNELTSTAPLGGKTSFGYNADGELTRYTDPAGNETTFTYNALGETLSQTDPLKQTASWTYDAAGLLTSGTDPDGNVTSYGYDGLGRLTSTKYGVKGTTDFGTVTSSYNSANEISKVADSLTGSYSYSYDRLGDVVQYSAPQGSISYAYDSIGQRTGMTVAGQSAISYSYDADGELTKLTQGAATASYGYDADGDLTSETLPNGIEQSSTYNAGSFLTRTTEAAPGGSTVGSVQYGYDADGLITSVGGSLAGAALPAAVASETYNADNELTEVDGTTKLSYDNDGNLTSDGSSTYGWSPAGELVSVTTPQASYAYSYDPAGQQILRTTGGKTTSSLYDGGTLVQQSAGGSPSASYLMGPGGTVQVTNSAGTYDPITNQVGSTIGLTSLSDQLSTTYSYDPAGNVVIGGQANPDPEQYATSQSSGSGLDEMGERYYDPSAGRFVSQDPLGFFSGTTNLYSYATGDPVSLNDPTGLCLPDCQSPTGPAAAALQLAGKLAQSFPPPSAQPCGLDPGRIFLHALNQVIAASPAGSSLSQFSQANHKTVGGCWDVSGYLGVGGTLGTCWVATPSGETGFTTSTGVGAGVPSIGGFVGGTISNARSLSDLSGKFTYADVSVGEALAAGGGGVAWGKNDAGQEITQFNAGWTPGFGLSPVVAAIGCSNTTIYQ